jgi:hypothetical protein
MAHDVALTETAQGAVLALDTATIAFGDVNVSQSKTSPFNVTNTGNLPATVTASVSGSGFGVSPATATTLTVGGSPLAGTATFTPGATGAQSGSVTFATAATDVLCSAPIGPIALSGNGINGSLGVSTSALDFKQVPCGQAAAAQTFTIANTGTASFTWSASLGKGASSPYTVSPSSGTLAPGATPTTITVTPAKIPFPSALTANLYGDTLTITPSGISGGSPQTVALTETAAGAVVTVSPSPLPAFPGTQEGQASAAATLTITNTGTLPVTITPTIGGTGQGSFLLATPGAKTLAINGGSYSPGPTFKPQATGTLNAQVSLAAGANDVLCQPLPAAVAMTGTGTNGSITLGASSLAIAAQPCGATAGLTQSLKLTNNGTASLTWNAAILGNTGFSVAPTTGQLAAGGGNVTITVTGPTFATTRGNVTPVTDTLRITTTAFGDVNHDVSLSSTPSGAILSWGNALTSLPFGGVQATPGGTKPKSLGFSVVNGGNLPATVSFGLTGNGQFTFGPQNTAVAGGGTLNATATFDPTTSGAQSGTMTLGVAGGTTLCGALPAGVSLSGTGQQGVLGGVPTGESFGLVCNASAASQTFQLTNTGAIAYDFNASGTGGYAVSPASGTVSPGTPVTVTVTPPAEGFATYGTPVNGTVSVTTDIPGDTTHSFSANGTVQGAVLSFVNIMQMPEPTVSFGSTVQGTGTYTTHIKNSGSGSPTVNVSITPSPNNPDYPSVAKLLINGAAATSFAAAASTSAVTNVTYGLVFNGNLPCGQTYAYTIVVTGTDKNGVCTNYTQNVSILDGDGC